MSKDIHVSVVIATYNRARQITLLLDDLRKQSLCGKQIEVIVVDDGSRDGTWAVLQEYVQQHSSHEAIDFITLHQENAGQSVARQNGANVSRGRILLFLDDDMRLAGTDFIAHHVRRHQSGGVHVVLGKILPPAEDPPRLAFEYFYERSLARTYTAFEAGILNPEGKHLFTGNVSISKAAFLKAGGFTAAFAHAEDKELGLRIESRTDATFVFEPHAVSYHHSATPSFASFAHRAYLYGYYDCELHRMYPDRTDLGPRATLAGATRIARMVASVLRSSKLVRRLATHAFTTLAGFFGRCGARAMATNCCSVIYLSRYIDGVFDGGAPAGFSLGNDVYRDLVGLLEIEGRPRTLGNVLWAVFGFDAFLILLLFRLRKAAGAAGVPLVGRLLRGLSFLLYGIELGSGIELGHAVYFVHPVGVVVGGKARVGEKTVFMGSNTVGTAKNNGEPTVGRRVLIGCGARILGPIRVGDGCSIGANAVVLRDVPEGSTAVGVPARLIHEAAAPATV